MSLVKIALTSTADAMRVARDCKDVFHDSFASLSETVESVLLKILTNELEYCQVAHPVKP